MSPGFVVGVDGGNTKTIAVVATTGGHVLGTAAGTCSDIYGPVPASQALDVLAGVVKDALRCAGVAPEAVVATVGSLAGADWPEDYELYRSELRARLGLRGRLEVINDGLGPLRLGDRGGAGVAVVLGTGAAVGARGPDGSTWHASFWLPVGGAEWLGRRAVTAVCRAALGTGPPTSLSTALLGLLGAPDEEAMLHALTRRDSAFTGQRWERDAGRLLVDHEALGDGVARDILAQYATALAPYAIVAAEKVRLGTAFSVLLTGGLLRHPRSSLAGYLAGEITALAPNATVTKVTTAPVAGAVLEAIALAGTPVTEELAQAVVGARLLLAHGPEAQAGSPDGVGSEPSWRATVPMSDAAAG